MNNASFEHFPAENHPIFSALEPGIILKIWRISLKTGLTKKQKVTELYFNENDAITEVYTHNTELKKRLLTYAARFPELCKQTEDDEQGGLRFEIDKNRISIRLTAPYSQERREAASKLAKKTNTFKTYTKEAVIETYRDEKPEHKIQD